MEDLNECRDCTLVVCFKDLEDPRIERTKKYPLIEIIFLTIVGTICGADSWRQIVLVGETKLEWMRKYFAYKNGIPSHDTIGRVFSLLNPKMFQACFYSWIKSIAIDCKGDIVAMDGKKSCNSHDGEDAELLHIVSAWSVKNGLALGQLKVKDKSNEITAIPELLKILDLKGAIVTIDAIGCQTKITANIVEDAKADYVLALKGNQKKLHDEVVQYFFEHKEQICREKIECCFKTVDKEHGRIETREYYQVELDSEVKEWIPEYPHWTGMKSIVMVDSQREIKGKTSNESRFYISSLALNTEKVAEAIRAHWGIENQLHWVLDVIFSDDKSRIRKDHAPQNFSLVKKWVLNLLKLEKTRKDLSLRMKRALAAMEFKYLEVILGLGLKN